MYAFSHWVRLSGDPDTPDPPIQTPKPTPVGNAWVLCDFHIWWVVNSSNPYLCGKNCSERNFPSSKPPQPSRAGGGDQNYTAMSPMP